MSVELVTYRNIEQVHWYRANGEPCHDAKLPQARKEKLFPSVTSILAIKDKPQLTAWKIGQMVAQALTMKREAGESDEAFIARVRKSDEEERAKAPDFGSMIHQALADFARTKSSRVSLPHLPPVFKWIDEHVQEPFEVEAKFCYSHLGYGGCIDYQGRVDGRSALIDWKTQGVKRDSPAYYDEWLTQLIAYAAGDMNVDLYSVVIDTTTPGKWHEPKLWDRQDKEWAWKEFIALRDAWFASRRYDPRVAEEIPF